MHGVKILEKTSRIVISSLIWGCTRHPAADCKLNQCVQRAVLMLHGMPRMATMASRGEVVQGRAFPWGKRSKSEVPPHLSRGAAKPA